MIKMENIGFGEQEALGDFVPESLFEAIDQLNNGGKSCVTNSSSSMNLSMDVFMDLELDLSSENMASFMELEQEIKEIPFYPEPMVRPSVIVKPRAKPSLTDIMSSCGIEYELPEDCNVSSPSSIHSDVQLEQNNHLIEELEDFFIKTEGKPTVVEDDVVTDLNLNSPVSTTYNGQNVIIIIAPSSPSESLCTTDSDPEWSPSPDPLSPAQVSMLNSKPVSLLSSKPGQVRPRKKYARSKPATPPSVSPYPANKKDRKKAQNRTAAFRYREKKKSELDLVEDELEALQDKNVQLKDKLLEMETEFKYLKKLMSEAGLGKYTLAVNY